MVSAISSKFVLHKLDGVGTYLNLVDACKQSADPKKCRVRYEYRGDTLSNYILPSLIIRTTTLLNSKLFDLISRNDYHSYFWGYTITFLTACSILVICLFVTHQFCIFLSAVSIAAITFTNPHLLDFQPHLFSGLFQSSEMVFPNYLCSTGAASILLIPMSLALYYDGAGLLQTYWCLLYMLAMRRFSLFFF